MTLDQFNEFCASLPHASFVEQWRGAQVWKVGGKVFAIGKTAAGQCLFTFKTSATNFYFLREQAGFRPAPYFASRGMPWIQQCAAGDDGELEYYLTESYYLVAKGLTKKERTRLGLLESATNPSE